MNATIYSRDTCPYCDYAKKYLTEKGIEFEEIKINNSEDKNRLFEAVGYPVRTVPQIFIDGNYVGGYQELIQNIK